MNTNENVVVKGRFDHRFYSIGIQDYNQILELINQYHESINNLPDEKRVVATPLLEGNTKDQCVLRVNEVVFV
ncbi:MAG: hypothetical protein R8G66_04875 [Cytophagales bacterium]|nr:hypothetical protein [Cytophagales bacterium]